MRAALLLIATARLAVAEPIVHNGLTPDDETEITGAPASRGPGVQLVTTSATLRYQLVTAPRIAAQIGALAVTGLDAAAGRGSAIAVLGDEVSPPARWPYAVDGDAHGKGALRPTAPDGKRIAALFAVTTFSLAASDQGLRMLEVRLRFEDGCAVWLNGIEVARQALPRDHVMALAAHPHGPAWETFFVPIAPTMLRLGDNTLAIEVHPSGRRLAPELAIDVIGRRDLGIVRGPVVAEIRETSARIALATDPGLPASLEWGTGEDLDHHLESPAGRQHTFDLAGLPPRAQITYRVHAGASQSARCKLHTAPLSGDVIRIGVYGDVRGGHGIHRRIVDAMLSEALDLVVVTGDMVLHGSDEADWQQFFTMTGEMLAQLLYFPAVGNHDLGWDGADVARRAQEVFTLPPGPAGRPDDAYWYSYDLADIHLVFLDSNAYERPEQERWLTADLTAARANHARAIIALTHDGPYARGLHRGRAIARDRYVPILAAHHVDLLLAGHDHLYQRGEAGGIRYIVSGGGGSSLYQISCGIADKPACPPDGMQKVLVEHHYITLTIDSDVMEMCPRRANDSLLEKCVRYKLWKQT
jgi:predicted phosphodiesterase